MTWLIISQVGRGCVSYQASHILSKESDNSISFYTPFTLFYREVLKGNFVTGATSLASTGNGSITISGVPSSSTIVKAFLFWTEEDSDNFSSGNFNGNPITGIKLAESDPACWGSVIRNALFYADVTNYVSGNGTYSLSSFSPACSFGESVEGATLVVIYCNQSEIKRTITIYTGDYKTPNNSSPYSWTHTNFTATNPVLDATYSISIANGQDAGSGSEFVYLNGNLITTMIDGLTGPNSGCVNGSLWDEFKGNATTWIPANATSATFSINNAAQSVIDCWNPILTILSVSSIDNETYNCATPVNVKESLTRPEIKIYKGFVEINSPYNFKIFSI
ncbi:MAG: DUF3344 domain-containing protein [candidate division WOR-3 bacterium]